MRRPVCEQCSSACESMRARSGRAQTIIRSRWLHSKRGKAVRLATSSAAGVFCILNLAHASCAPIVCGVFTRSDMVSNSIGHDIAALLRASAYVECSARDVDPSGRRVMAVFHAAARAALEPPLVARSGAQRHSAGGAVGSAEGAEKECAIQ